MNNKFMQKKSLRMSIYLLGIMITGLGINVLLRSTLGAGAWDTVTNNFSELVHISLGTASAIINITVLLLVLIYNKQVKYLLILIPIVGIALAIDFWDLIVFKEFEISQFLLQLVFFIIGGIILPLGLSLMIITKYPAMVYDELTISMMRMLKIKKFFNMRIAIELFAIALATLFGFLAGIRFGAVNLGSFILAVAIGPIITIHLRWLGKFLKTGSISE